MTEPIKYVDECTEGGVVTGYLINCPGCGSDHIIRTKRTIEGVDPVTGKKQPLWTFDGNMEKPTFSPSIDATWGPFPNGNVYRCHFFLKKGLYDFRPDCTHKMAGQKNIPMLPVD